MAQYPPGGELPADSTLELLALAQRGDEAALDQLFARYLPRLRRWASGRLPQWARNSADTQDLVQETLIQTLRNVEGFEARHEGALQAYLRQALMNRIRDELRKFGRRPTAVGLDENLPVRDSSPLEQAIGAQAVERYDAGLARLRPSEKEAIIARVEMGCSYQEIADLQQLLSADAARKACQRALLRLARELEPE